jgi:hypothetical protein
MNGMIMRSEQQTQRYLETHDNMPKSPRPEIEITGK